MKIRTLSSSKIPPTYLDHRLKLELDTENEQDWEDLTQFGVIPNTIEACLKIPAKIREIIRQVEESPRYREGTIPYHSRRGKLQVIEMLRDIVKERRLNEHAQ